MAETKMEKIEKLINKGAKFIGLYGMGSPTYPTNLSGNTPIEAIKDFHKSYNAILYAVYDVDAEIMYNSRENDEEDERGYLNRTFYLKETGEDLFNEDELTKPIVKLKASKIDEKSWDGWINRSGKFFACGHECHRYLADELFLSKTVEKPEFADKYMDGEKMLDEMGWVRVSSKRFHSLRETRMTNSQKKTIVKLMDVLGDVQYEFQYHMQPKDEIEKYLFE